MRVLVTGPAGQVGWECQRSLQALSLPGGQQPDTTAETGPAVDTTRRRSGTKQEAVIAMLSTEGGATIADIMAATGWAGHTTRGFLSGALKKKLGLSITSEKVEGRGRVYQARKPD